METFTYFNETRTKCLGYLTDPQKATTCYWCVDDLAPAGGPSTPEGGGGAKRGAKKPAPTAKTAAVPVRYTCPVNFVGQTVSYIKRSAVNSEKYSICVAVDEVDVAELKERFDDVEVSEPSFYEVEGAFCSPNCVMAYINDKGADPKYMYSKQYLHQMTGLAEIKPSHHRLLLERFGGPLAYPEYHSTVSLVHFNGGHEIHTKPVYIVHERSLRV